MAQKLRKRENRSEPRSLCSDLVKLEWRNRAGRMNELPAVLEDISPGGACLQVESPVPVNTEVQVSRGPNWGITCRTTYCEFREIGYFVGLEFPQDARWHKGAFNPQHLLDLQELIHGLNSCVNN